MNIADTLVHNNDNTCNSMKDLANEAMDQKRSWTTSKEEMINYEKAKAVQNESIDNGETSRIKNEVNELVESDDGSVVSC